MRTDALEQWLTTLTPEARIVASTAIALNTNVVEALGARGGCYHFAFFLYEYLRSKFLIDVEPVVAWVNDGRDAYMMSHAWIEFEGKITDVSLTKTEYPEENLSGALIVMGEVIRPGDRTYTYHKARTPQALAILTSMDPREVAQDETRHVEMGAISKSPKQMRRFLKSARPESRFEALAKAIVLSSLPASDSR